MAIIKQGILGGFTGKVAGVVGTSWKGRAVMKGRPQSVSNPKTDAQVEQRAKFSSIAELAASILTTFVQPVENPISGNISGYNRFVKDNKEAFDALGALVGANFKCGGGKIVELGSFDAQAESNSSEITLDWTNQSGISALRLTDKVYAAAFRADGSLFGVTSGETTRSAQSASISANPGVAEILSTDTIYVIYAAVSADGRDVSITTTAVEVTISE